MTIANGYLQIEQKVSEIECKLSPIYLKPLKNQKNLQFIRYLFHGIDL